MSTLSVKLADRHSELTRSLIVGAAVDLLTEAPIDTLSAKAIAERAGMSERTIFRHFNVREHLLDAVATEIIDRLELPSDPATIQELIDYPAVLYRRFERHSALTRAALHSELYERVRKLVHQRRGTAVARLIDAAAPDQARASRRRVAANVEYHLVASAWHYFRFHLGFSPSEAIECARTAVRDSLRGLGIDFAGRSERPPEE
jgi:AcrR family transcriptional regulator